MKYYGKIGYAVTVETAPGVWEEQITERTYCGDVTRRNLRAQNTSNLNDNLDVSNVMSMVADPYALEHLGHMRYITWMNSKWKISSVEYVHPRLNITIVGVYNGEEQT